MFLRGFVLLILLFTWGSSIASLALQSNYNNSNTDTLRSDTLKAVEIIKQRDQIPLSTTVSAQQLSSKDLENSNSLNVADAIKGFSGVQIRDYGGIGGMKTIDVRSLGSKHTAVFYDGIAVNDAQSGEIDLSKFSLDNLQSISLYNNNHYDIAQPAKAFASASVLYLQSKVPIFEGGKKRNLRAGLQGGSFGLINPSLSIQRKITENTSLSVSTEWLKANGEYDFHYKNQALLDTVIRRRNTDIETFRAEAFAQGLLRDSSQWRINGYMYFSDRGLPGPAVNNKYYVLDRQWDKDLFLQSLWSKRFSNFYSLKINGKYTYSWLRYLDPNYSNTTGKLENKYKQEEVYFSAINVFQLNPALKAAVSADYLNNTLDATLPQFAYPTRNTGLVNVSVDYETDSWRIQGNLLSTFLDEMVKAGNNAKSKTAYSPSLSFSWKPFNLSDFYIRSSFKSIFRMPSFNDSYYTLIGSTSLEPEYAKEYNLGFTLKKDFNGSLKSLVFKTDAYHNRIKDRISAIPKHFRWTMFNIGEVEISGLDIGMQGHIALSALLNADFSINTTMQQALDKTRDGNYYGEDVPYAPRNSSAASVSVYYQSWVFGSSLLYSGGKYSSRLSIPSNYIEDWFLQDLSLSYHFNLASSKLKVTGEVNNLYNTDYVILNNYPMPGRNFRIGLQLTL